MSQAASPKPGPCLTEVGQTRYAPRNVSLSRSGRSTLSLRDAELPPTGRQLSL